MNDNVIDVDRALAVLASDAPLPREPKVCQFVAGYTSRGPYDTTGQISRYVSEKTRRRAWCARRRIQARFNAEMRALVPGECTVCGGMFARKRIDQRRCRTCIEGDRK